MIILLFTNNKMNDLIYKLQLYDLMSPRQALKEFKLIDQYFVVKQKAYLYKEVKRVWPCINCCFNHDLPQIMYSKCMCKEKTELSLMNGTGVPCGFKQESKFYRYHKRLVILMEKKICQFIVVEETMAIKWLIHRNYIFTIKQLLLPELNDLILKYYLSRL